MTLTEVSTKIDLRLNKGASSDYDNIWKYVKKEAFNKGINEWVRRQKNGKNQTREGDEETANRVDDLQILLVPEVSLSVRRKGGYAQTQKLPSDYLYYKRLTPIVSKGNCQGVKIKSHLREEANVDDLLPICSFEFEETFHTLINNRAHVYHNNDFIVDKVFLVYYRKPKYYDFKNMSEVVEWKDDVCDILVDEACKIISSDIESLNQKALAQERAEDDN